MGLKIFSFFVILVSLPSLAETCPNKQYWVKPHFRTAYIRSDGVSVSASNVIGHCRSKSKAYEYWADLISDGLPQAWNLKSEKGKNWTRAELEKLINVLEKVPRYLWNKVKIYRGIKSILGGNPGSSRPGMMVLYDKAFKDDAYLNRVVVHELAHQEFRNLNDLDIALFKVNAGIITDFKTGKVYSTGKFVMDDDHIGPDEAFANAMEVYLMDPTRLKFKSPQLYNWITSEYGDKLKK
jgi:hypothetical protein